MAIHPLLEHVKLAEIFAKLNMCDLPAMAEHVQELNALLTDDEITAADLINVLSRDYALLIKLLRVVNSPYYSPTRPVTSVSMAANIVGVQIIRELAGNIPLFEDAVRLGIEQNHVLPLIVQSCLAGGLAKNISIEKKSTLLHEEVYVCALLHHLGRTVLSLYLPDIYRNIVQLTETGTPEEDAAMACLDGITLSRFGMEIANFWNFSPDVAAAMDPHPPLPKDFNDRHGYLLNLVCFSNRFVKAVCEGTRINKVMDQYGEILSLDKEEALHFLDREVETIRESSRTLRHAIVGLKLTGRIRQLEKTAKTGSVRPKKIDRFKESDSTPVETIEPAASPAAVSVAPTEDPMATTTRPADAAPLLPENLLDGIQMINKLLVRPFSLQEFTDCLFRVLQERFYCDRVILAALIVYPHGVSLTGRYGVSDHCFPGLASFQYPLGNLDDEITRCLVKRQDLVISPGNQMPFPPHLAELTGNCFLYFLPVCLSSLPLGLLSLSLKEDRPSFTDTEFDMVKTLRDLTAMAIDKHMVEFFIPPGRPPRP